MVKAKARIDTKEKPSKDSGNTRQGFFQKGGKAGPGRPKGSKDFVLNIRHETEKLGINVVEEFWKAFHSAPKTDKRLYALIEYLKFFAPQMQQIEAKVLIQQQAQIAMKMVQEQLKQLPEDELMRLCLEGETEEKKDGADIIDS